MFILLDDRLLPFRTWIYSRNKKVSPLTLHSLWVRCQNPETVLVSEFAEIEENVTLLQGAQIRGQSKIGKGTVVDSNTIITGSVIGAQCHIHPGTIIVQSHVGDNCEIGPHASIEFSHIGDGSHIGFTAQIKRSILDERCIAKHHCYIGDTKAGKEISFGAGSITGNYDGTRKHTTVIGNEVLIGTNVNLVAPIIIGNGSYIAAGTTVTKKIDIPPHSFVIGRAPTHVSENIYSFSTERGYEYIVFEKERLEKMRVFFGEELPHWLVERNPRFGNESPLDVFRKDKNRFDDLLEQTLNSCCT